MASETLDEKNTGNGASAEEKGMNKEEKEEEEIDQSKEQEDKEEDRASGDSEKDVSQEKEEPEEIEGAEEEEEKGGSRKVKGSVKRTSMKNGEGSTEKKRRRSVTHQEPVTPTERPVRERKTVERYSASSSEKPMAPKGLSIEKGRGSHLKAIPNVAFKLSKKKPDENLQMLHTLLFGKKAKTHNLKRNLGQFSGFVWVENKEKQRVKVKEKLDKFIKGKLLDFCDLLDIPVSKATVKKEELTAKLLEFLECPCATTDILLAEKEQKDKKHKRKATTSTEKTSGQASVETSTKKQKHSPDVGKKQKRSSKTKDEVEDDAEPSYTKDDSDEDDKDETVEREKSDSGKSETDEEEDKEEQVASKKGSTKKKRTEAKAKEKSTPVKKSTPAKSVKGSSKLKKGAADDERVSGSPLKSKVSATKRQIDGKGSQKRGVLARDKSSSKKQPGKSDAKISPMEQGNGKGGMKAKSEPSREELHAAITDILKEVDFNTATLSDILRQLGSQFGVDLKHRKAEVKSIITDIINNMTDDEEDEEDEGNAEETEEDVNEETDKDNA